MIGRRKNRGGIDRYIVCNQHLLRQANEKYCQADRDIFEVSQGEFSIRKLWQDFLVIDNWSGNELGEKSDKQAIMQKVMVEFVASVEINEIGNLLKCKK